ncbi:Sporulation kinase A [bacterium HR39]|nr:Sporulation kinase A [bacterium HR39]
MVEEERLAQLGRLASATTHEVNNPLAGLLTVVDTLRRRGEDPGVRSSALDLLERGLLGIRNVVRAMLIAYKEEDSGAPLTARALDDLEILIRHEVQRKRLNVDWRNGLQQTWELDSGLIRQALLNLLLNACRVSPVGGRVLFLAVETAEGVRFLIEDHGPGLPPALRELLVTGEPSVPLGRGLGIWTVARLVRRLNGKAHVETPSEGGTRIMLEFPARPLRSAA